MTTTQFHDLPSNEHENWLITATEWLIEHGHLPFTEEAWTSDKYQDRIHDKAVELWEESLSTKN